MAISAQKTDVGDVPTLLVSPPDPLEYPSSGPPTVVVLNAGNNVVFVGGDDVTVDQGFPLEQGAAFKGSYQGRDQLYGVVASGVGDVRAIWVT